MGSILFLPVDLAGAVESLTGPWLQGTKLTSGLVDFFPPLHEFMGLVDTVTKDKYFIFLSKKMYSR